MRINRAACVLDSCALALTTPCTPSVGVLECETLEALVDRPQDALAESRCRAVVRSSTASESAGACVASRVHAPRYSTLPTATTAVNPAAATTPTISKCPSTNAPKPAGYQYRRLRRLLRRPQVTRQPSLRQRTPPRGIGGWGGQMGGWVARLGAQQRRRQPSQASARGRAVKHLPSR